MRFAQRERVIGTECDALGAEEFEQQLERVGIVNERVHIEPCGSTPSAR